MAPGIERSPIHAPIPRAFQLPMLVEDEASHELVLNPEITRPQDQIYADLSPEDRRKLDEDLRWDQK